MTDDRRLIEDYLPIQAISKEASREKSVRKGHICTLHLWWARRPLVACRAAVYGALVPADRWVKEVDLKNPPADAAKLKKAGIAAIYTPKDYDLTAIIADIVEIVDRAWREAA